MRDDFSERVKRTVAARAGHRCSNPDCRAHTSGPQTDPAKSMNVGVAAHISAASEGGPRYDASLTVGERCGEDNAIWTCQNCAKKIDNDPALYTELVLRGWKATAEERARSEVGKTVAPPLRIELPKPINRVGHRSVGHYTRTWSVRVRLIATAAPADVIELGVREPGVAEWHIDEIFQEGGPQLRLPFRVEGVRDVWIRAASPRTEPKGPIRVDELQVWVQDVHDEQHTVTLTDPEQD